MIGAMKDLKEMNKLILLLFLIIVMIPAGMAFAQDSYDYEEMSDEEYEAILDKGKKVYEVRCLLCHGEKGDGNGLAGVIRRAEKSGRVLEIYPRDLTLALFRFRTTPTGCLSDDQDLLDIIVNGVPRSFMPSHKELPPEDIEATKEYIKTFSFRWEEEDLCDPISVNKPDWIGNPDSVVKGKKIYQDMKCGECHGYKGTGDGPKSNDLKDDWGKQILPFNFATGDLKRGSSAENVYITFTTGLDGTGMPSYEDSLNEEDRWHLVSYTLKLMKKVE
jgi:mono/diheme cytochrome c family protein